MDTILITPLHTKLNEVRVLASRAIVKYEQDKLIYNVEADPENVTLSAFEMLRKVPMINIDGEDNIELNGGTFQVLVNDKPSSLFVQSPEEALKNMPASSIKSFEIITNPPARYQSEGVSGIINIITHKKNVAGYNGSVRGNYVHHGGPSTGGNLTAKAGKLGLSSLWGYSQNNSPVAASLMHRLNKLNNTFMQQEGENRSRSHRWNGGIELSWQLAEHHLVNAHYNRHRSNSRSLSAQQVELNDSAGTLMQAYTNGNTYNNIYEGNDLGIDYQLSFKKNTQQLLTLSYKEVTNAGNSASEMQLQPKIGALLSSSRSANNNSFTERTAQIDYVQPFKKYTLEAGIKTIFRVNASGSQFERLDPATDQYINNGSLNNGLDNTQDIYSVYTSLTLKVKTLTFRTGVRWEQTRIAASFHATGTAANQLYTNLLPNASLSKRIGKTGNLSLSYSQRILRPSLYYINPFIDNRDPYNLYYGNPNLVPTVTHVGNLTFNTYFSGVYFNLNLYHNLTNGSILQYTTLSADTVSRTTYGNIGKDRSTGLSLSTGLTLFKKLSLSFNSSGQYQQYTSIIDRTLGMREGFSYQFSGNIGYSFANGFRAGINAGYNSARIIFQGRNTGFVHNSASLSKSFLKNNKASFSLIVSNPVQPVRRSVSEMESEYFYMLRESEVLIRRASLTFNYRFGKLQSGIKHKKRGIENDDLKPE